MEFQGGREGSVGGRGGRVEGRGGRVEGRGGRVEVKGVGGREGEDPYVYGAYLEVGQAFK